MTVKLIIKVHETSKMELIYPYDNQVANLDRMRIGLCPNSQTDAC